mmetsp:Transcript_4083/g.9851  ORF Transcript_4083/g.9851 Transcript_4083/m.9851 type:complete len:210 (+) Transcript_4083:60-689(+)
MHTHVILTFLVFGGSLLLPAAPSSSPLPPAAPSSSGTTDTDMHLVSTMAGPHSSYSRQEIHFSWNPANDVQRDPPSHAEYLRCSFTPATLIFIEGARAISSSCNRLSIPSNIVVPPDNTTFPKRSWWMSTSHFMIDWKIISWMPLASLPISLGEKSGSGQRKRSAPTVMMFPSSSSYVFSLALLSVQACNSVSKSRATYANFSFTSRTM